MSNAARQRHKAQGYIWDLLHTESYHTIYTTLSYLHVTPDIVQLIGWWRPHRGFWRLYTYTCLILQGVYAILSFHSLTLGITLGCAAVSSLEAGPLVLARVGSETGAATFLDLKIQKHKSFFSRSSESNFSCSYFTCPQVGENGI